MFYKLIFCVIILLISSCSEAFKIQTITFPDSEITYVKGRTANLLSGGSILVLDRYQYSYKDNKTTLIRTDSTTNSSNLKSLIDSFPIPIMP
jgi:hypothetical protein